MFSPKESVGVGLRIGYLLRTKFEFNGARCKKAFYLGEIDNLKPKIAGKGKAGNALEQDVPKEQDEAETALEQNVPKELNQAETALESRIPKETNRAETAQEPIQVPKEKVAGKGKTSKTSKPARKTVEAVEQEVSSEHTISAGEEPASETVLIESVSPKVKTQLKKKRNLMKDGKLVRSKKVPASKRLLINKSEDEKLLLQPLQRNTRGDTRILTLMKGL